MRPRHLPGWLTGILLFFGSTALEAGAPPDPLRLVPAQAEVVFAVPQPRQIAETVYHLDVVKELQKIEVVREIYDSTQVRRVFQLLAYFEKKLGHKRFDLLDRLAGGGIVVAGKLTGGTPAALAVFQAKDEELLKQFAKLGLEVIEQELIRQEAKERPRKGTYRKVATVQVGTFHMAVAGSAFLAATHVKALELAIDCHLDNGKNSIAGAKGLAEARQSLPASAQAWVWLNLEAARTFPQVKDSFKIFSRTFPFGFFFHPMIDVAERSPYICAALSQPDGNTFVTSLRMGRGREGMGKLPAILLPKSDEPGSLPLLEPANVQASFSYYFDLSTLWQNKDKWLSDAERKELAKVEKYSALFLGGVKLETLLKQAGTHHRFVQTTTSNYRKTADQGQDIGSYGFVTDMRDKAFSRSMETILRGAGLFASTQFNLKMVEEKHGPYTIVSYHLPKGNKIKFGDVEFGLDISPCFVTVGNQFIVSSSVELGRELVDLVAKEQSSEMSAATTRFRIYARGYATGLRATEDQLKTQIILGQALSPKAAQQQVRDLIALVERLGVLQVEINYGSNDFRYDIRLKLGK